jgi:cytochrome c peroxidase
MSTDVGAAMSHTQDLDLDHDDMIPVQAMHDFRNFDRATGERHVVELPLTDDDGTTVVVPIVHDPGMALITGRLSDLGRFKVPQLRNLRRGAPYFHDCSVPDLEGVVAYFNSPLYGASADGRRFPIAMTPQEQADLLAFLRIL